MKVFQTSITLLSGFMVFASADVPVDRNADFYRTLWTSSPFTTPPPPPDKEPDVNPMDDYALSAVSPVEGGYMVVLQSKKDPAERIRILPDQPGDFKVVEVIQGERARSTSVRISHGSKTGVVEFDEKFLVLRNNPVPAPPGQPGQPGQPPQNGQPPQPGQPANAQPAGQPAPNQQGRGAPQARNRGGVTSPRGSNPNAAGPPRRQRVMPRPNNNR